MGGLQKYLSVVLLLTFTSRCVAVPPLTDDKGAEAGFQPSLFQQILKLHEQKAVEDDAPETQSKHEETVNRGEEVEGKIEVEESKDIFLSRSPRQSFQQSVPGGVDFSQATRTADGRLCVIKEESVETLSKDPILECKHKNVQKCHYTYLTKFKPAQEEACEENFEKTCQITFRQEAVTEVVRKCYRPLEKVCNGQGPQECRTVYESSCSTKYVRSDTQAGKFVGDTKCEKLPVEICGSGCVTEEGPEECHDKSVDTLVDVPEETCDLNPQKTCRLVTKLVPSLTPTQECTNVPQETCNLKFSQPERTRKPLRTEWCLDESSPSSSSSSISSNGRTQSSFNDIDSVFSNPGRQGRQFFNSNKA